jgi:HAD superfamily hydrolase (TIGR01484 family)
MLRSDRWIISDVDGCLAPEESIAWNAELFGKVARLSQEASAGRGDILPITLCSGRPQPYLEVLMKLLDVRAPAIAENGAVFYTLHDNVSTWGPGVTEEKILGLRALRAFIETRLLADFPQAVIQFGKEAQISIFSERPEIFGGMKPRIEAFCAQNGGPEVHISASHYYLNISLDGVDKGSALRVLMEQLGIGKDDAVGIGDTEGDLPLRRSVGVFACPSNSVLAIKEVADYVSPYPSVEGVLDILSQPFCRRMKDEC